MLLESVARLPTRSANATRPVRFLVDFYERWNRAQPDPARAARAVEWRTRLTPASPGSALGRGSEARQRRQRL
jgi:hypothetical protein